MRKLLPLLILALLLSMAAGANGEPLKVVATHSILADVVSAIGTDHIELVTLMPKGSDPHSFQPSPRDLTPLADADVVFVNGGNFEENLLPTIENAAGDTPVVEASACVEVLPFGAGRRADEHDDDDHADEHDDDDHGDEHDDDDHADEHDDDDHGDEHDDDDHADEHDDDDHADEHDDDDEHADSNCDDHQAEYDGLVGQEPAAHDHDHAGALGRLEDIDCGGGHGHGEVDEHGHRHGACDPHVWLDPHNTILWALQIRDTLSALDSHNAQHYADNAADYIQALLDLETDFILPLLEELPVEKRVLVTSHDSFSYLAVSFDFEIIGTAIPGFTTTEEISARDMAALIDLIKAEGVPAIFGETVVNTSAMQAVADETGAKLVVLYADTLALEGEASTYLGYMRSEYSNIVNALKES